MKTTLEIPDNLMRELKERAAREGKTMSEIVEAALRMALDEKPVARELPPLPTFDSGGLLLNIDSRAEWYDQIEEDDEDGGNDVRR